MQNLQKKIIYNHFNKNVLRIIRDRSTVAATVCPYVNGLDIDRPKAEITATKYLPYDDVPGPQPIPILGNTWR